MSHWLEEYPPLRVMRKHIAAADYNRIRLALLRERLPWQLSLKRIRCLQCILDDSAWVCVDECQNHLPILAWTHFDTAQRSALDAQVACELRLYHMHAGLLMGEALNALLEAVAEHHKYHCYPHYPVSHLKNEPL